jgi:hypothetical protein
MYYEVVVVILCLILLIYVWGMTSPNSEGFDLLMDMGVDDTSSILRDGYSGTEQPWDAVRGPTTSWRNVTLPLRPDVQTDNSKPVDPIADSLKDPSIRPYVRLYSDYKGQNLEYEYMPRTGFGYDRQVLRIPLKHIEIYLPSLDEGPVNQTRFVEIYNIYGGKPNASTLSSFYNTYLDPDWEMRANRGKYKLLVRALPGDRISMDVTEPVGQIIVSAVI